MATAKGAARDGKYDLEGRLVDFAVRVLDLVEALPRTRVGVHIGSQLLRSGTSPAAHYGEAQAAESRADFLHKMKMVLKELRESRVWIILVSRRALVKPPARVTPLAAECDELIAIFVASILTARRRTRPDAASAKDQ